MGRKRDTMRLSDFDRERLNTPEHQRLQEEAIRSIRETVKEIGRTHEAKCKYCDYVATGETLGDVLEDLGGHGEYVHRGLFEQMRRETER